MFTTTGMSFAAEGRRSRRSFKHRLTNSCLA